MDPTMIPWAVGGVLTLCGLTLTGLSLRRNSNAEADKRYIAALEQMRKDDLETLKNLVGAIHTTRDEQLAMHRSNKEEHDRDMMALRGDHADIVKQHHEDLMEIRNALRGAEGAVNAAVNAVDRWRQH